MREFGTDYECELIWGGSLTPLTSFYTSMLYRRTFGIKIVLRVVYLYVPDFEYSLLMYIFLLYFKEVYNDCPLMNESKGHQRPESWLRLVLM